MKKNFVYLTCLFGAISLASYGKHPTDSIRSEVNLSEVAIYSEMGSRANRPTKGYLASIDEFLQSLSGINMVRRGGFAWEVMVNNMPSERLSTTIEGMKIFHACTDKMDPVTSYVESGNLQRISINSGLDAQLQSTGNIGGSINLHLNKAGFDGKRLGCRLFSGIESNGWLQTYGADAAFSSHHYYMNVGLSHRQSSNYKAGGGETVSFSQFKKNNAFVNFGYRPSINHILEGSMIYDVARHVGYPALLMDVKLAEAIIGSLSYKRKWTEGWLTEWETKAYYNHITHEMDDTKRPDVPVHMDMPGRNQTAGLYSLVFGRWKHHTFQMNYDAYYNKAFADMTMYPPKGAPEYMLTWPDVRTFNTSISMRDDYDFAADQRLHIAFKGSYQTRKIASDEGYRALQVYFPEISKRRSDVEGRLSFNYQYFPNHWLISVGLGIGSRTPSVSEYSGYFLFNTFDNYDYMGNPNIKNEWALEPNLLIEWRTTRLVLKAACNAFFFKNYMIGIPDARFSAMTIGARGVKVYQNLSSSQIMNLSLSADYRFCRCFSIWNTLNYAYGRDNSGNSLPLIAPLGYKGGLRLRHGIWIAETNFEVSTSTHHYGEKYGGIRTPGYGLWNLSGGAHFTVGRTDLEIRGGIDNVLDRRYTTFSNWNHIPQKGRNFFLNLTAML